MNRNDQRLIEDCSVMLAMYADMHGLTVDEGARLAEQIGEELERSAEDRRQYVGDSA